MKTATSILLLLISGLVGAQDSDKIERRIYKDVEKLVGESPGIRMLYVGKEGDKVFAILAKPNRSVTIICMVRIGNSGIIVS